MSFDTKIVEQQIGPRTWRIEALADRNQFHDPGGEAEAAGIPESFWSLFGQLWESSIVLALYLDQMDLEGRRILEVGCGLALPSLIAHAHGADVLATDLHPEVPRFLERNAERNQLTPVPYLQVDWHHPPDDLGRFDLIVASDVLYEPDHPEQVVAFLRDHLAEGGEILLVDPGRQGNGRFRRMMMDEAGFECEMTYATGDNSIRLMHFRVAHGRTTTEPREEA